jgi:hypothetical protein
MKAFRSERKLAQYFSALAEKHRLEEKRRQEKLRRKVLRDARRAGKPTDNMVIITANESELMMQTSESVSVVAENVTNTQHAGVDEGDIVKVHGNHLVVLRRGRLFTIAINDGDLKPISAVNAFGPNIDPSNSWYDEMLISGNNVVVIGYSYYRGGTEVGLFDISDDGRLTYRSTHQLRSDDYYSSRNYASRLIGNKLIFYAPQRVDPYASDPTRLFPAVRNWHDKARDDEFEPIVDAKRIYKPDVEFDADHGLTLHTVTVCDLSNPEFSCEATSVLGPSGRVFYVSRESVYVWANSWGTGKKIKSLLFRMPLDGSAPGALQVSGGPVDQFSFLESDDHYLNVVVRSDARGDGMWAAEVAQGDVALMRVPVSSFSDGSTHVPAYRYRALEKPDEDYMFQNRFVGDYLLYGTGNGWESSEDNKKSKLFIVGWKTNASFQLSLPHGVDRIEQLGSNAVVVGADKKDLHFSSVRLDYYPLVVSDYKREGASQGERRSHGFFYKPDNVAATSGSDSQTTGTLGLPISTPGRPGYEHLFKNSAAILFLRNDDLQLREIGELSSQAENATDDHCLASCVDWYGNARPLFLRGRIFALLGYEIVEGGIEGGRIRELRRISYARETN